MNRTKAVACYKEITGISESMGSNSFNLVSIRGNHSKTRDYQMRIIMSMDDEIKQQVTSIVKKPQFSCKRRKRRSCNLYSLG